MASRIKITTEKGSLDLGGNINKEFFTTKQIFDLSNFETRNADFTKSLSVPATANNINILGDGRGIIDCRIFMDDNPLSITSKLLSATSKTIDQIDSYNITIMYGNFSLFDDIKKGDISDINWGDLAIEWEDTEVAAASENTDDLVCPVADWYDRNSFPVVADGPGSRKTLDINSMGFFIYCKEIINRIIQEAGYTLVVDDSVPDDYNTIALACPVERFFREQGAGQGLIIARNSVSGNGNNHDFTDAPNQGGLQRFILNAAEGDVSAEYSIGDKILVDAANPSLDGTFTITSSIWSGSVVVLDTEETFIVNSSGTLEVIGDGQSVRGATERAEFDTSIIPGLWDAVNWEFEPTTTAEYEFSLKGTYSYIKGIGTTKPSRFVIFQNGLEIGNFPIYIEGADVPFYYSINITAIGGAPGDVLYAEIQAAEGDVGDFVTIEPGTEFQMKTLVEFYLQPRIVQPSQHIPQIEKSTFLANMLKLFNLTLTTSTAGKVVTIKAFDKIYDSEDYDFSEFLDLDKEILSERSIESLGQNNELQWENDNLLRRDANHILKIDNQLLAKDKKVIEMEFSACDNSLLYFDSSVDTYLKAKIPLSSVERQYLQADYTITIASNGTFVISDAGVDYEVGDFFRIFRLGPPVSYRYYRVIQKTSELVGTLQTTIDGPDQTADRLFSSVIRPSAKTFDPRLAIIRSDGGEDNYTFMQGSQFNQTTLSSDALTANWMDSLKWSEIVKSQYKRIIEALDVPDIRKAWFNLPLSIFLSLDLTRPVYVKQFGRRYYMNRVEQYRLDNSVRIELIGIDNFE